MVRMFWLATTLIFILSFFSSCNKYPDEIIQNAPTEITQNGAYEAVPVVDYGVTNVPVIVSDESEFIDDDKQYVLPDGYLYQYEAIQVYTATNQLSIATDEDGSIFNGCGYQDNARIRSTLEITGTDYSFVTGFIPIKSGDIIYFRDNIFKPTIGYAGSMNIGFYNSDRQMIAGTTILSSENYFVYLDQSSDGYVSSMKINEDNIGDDLAYIRFTLIGSGEDKFISVNEPLDEYQEVYSWKKVAEYISGDWYCEITDTVDKINSMVQTDESNVTKFILSSDIHLAVDSSTSYTQNLGKVCVEVMRTCDIPFFVSAGDNCTQSTGHMPSVFEDNFADLLQQLSPIPQKNILLTVGNHDGATGMAYDHNGDKVYYRFQLNNEQRASVFFEWQKSSNEYKTFDSDGTYYYLDDSSTQTRYIVLNSFWSQWAGNDEGYVPNIQRSFFHSPLFGSQQLNWLAEEALDMPPEYGAVIITHHAPSAKDFEVFKGIIEAFNGQTTYKGSYEGAEDWQNTSIAVNYQNASGEIIAVFQGHKHVDSHEYIGDIPYINITTTGQYSDVRDENAEERVKDTSSEFAVDAVVVDRTQRKIYLTRLGAGNDRVIEY